MGRYAAAVCLLFFFSTLTQVLFSQSDAPDVIPRTTAMFLMTDRGASVPPVSLLTVSSSYGLSHAELGDFHGSVLWSYRGSVAVGFRYEPAFGDPIRRLVPANQAEVRIQLLEQRSASPAVALIYRQMLTKRSLEFGLPLLQRSLPLYVADGLGYAGMNLRQSLLGAGLSAVLGKKLTVSGIAGLRTTVWQQGRTTFFSGSADPANPYINVDPNEAKTEPSLVLMGSAVLRISEPLSVTGDLRPLPLLQIDRTTKAVTLRDGYLLTAGVQYQLPFDVTLAMERSSISGYVAGAPAPQWRLALSAAVFNAD